MKTLTVAAEKVEAGRRAIDDLDLDPIKVKLLDPDEGLAYDRRQVDAMEKWYRRFLFLTLKYPDRSIVPNMQIDTFWHFHILDTMKYADDCAAVFGHFLHHFPYFGMRGEEDAKNLKSAFAATCELFSLEFGEPLPLATASECANACRTPCDAGHKFDNSRPTLASLQR